MVPFRIGEEGADAAVRASCASADVRNQRVEPVGLVGFSGSAIFFKTLLQLWLKMLIGVRFGE
jgi:hypothetical protein